VQPESNQMIPRILFQLHLGAAVGRMIRVRPGPRPLESWQDDGLAAAPDRLSNGPVTVALCDGGIGSIAFDGAELLGPAGLALHLRRDTTDTWTFHTDRWEEPVEAALSGPWTVEETGPLRGRARLDGRLGTSRIRLTVALCRGAPAVRVGLEVNFDERHRLLQLPIELAAPPSRWTDGIAEAWIDRRPSPAEWPFLGWSRLRVGDADIALVTRDIYSHSVDGARWQPTLLRSPRMAWGGGDPRTYAGSDHHTDQGTHRFAFDLHFGAPLTEADLTAALEEAAHPLVVFDRYEGMDRPAWGPVPPRGLWGPAMLRNAADGRVADPGHGAGGGLFRRPGHEDAG
jgi:alpha-mannosidase